METRKMKKIQRAYNETAVFYDERYYDIQIEKYNHIINYLMKKITAYKENKIVIADIGCGTGIFLEYLLNILQNRFRYILKSKTTNIKYIGIDISSAMLNIFKDKLKQYRKCFIHAILLLGNGEHLPVGDQFSDITVSFTTLQNVENRLLFIEELLRITKNNGILVITALRKNIDRHFLETIINTYRKAKIIKYGKILNFRREDIGLFIEL
ncbi:MAG: class I SAM-dependent methyltransferase [Candidatus Asgardarchaeum sp.]